MGRSREEVEKMITAVAANPVGAKLLKLINAAESAAELHRIHDHDILETAGLTEEEREALREAVSLRFGALNAAATPHDKPRWDVRQTPPKANGNDKN
jgi:hypothetical protein